MIEYRVKTEEEFLEEFGRGWRNRVSATFPEEMDYLLGEEIVGEKLTEQCKKGYTLYVPDRLFQPSSYSLSPDMYKKVDIKPIVDKRVAVTPNGLLV